MTADRRLPSADALAAAGWTETRPGGWINEGWTACQAGCGMTFDRPETERNHYWEMHPDLDGLPARPEPILGNIYRPKPAAGPQVPCRSCGLRFRNTRHLAVHRSRFHPPVRPEQIGPKPAEPKPKPSERQPEEGGEAARRPGEGLTEWLRRRSRPAPSRTAPPPEPPAQLGEWSAGRF